MKKIDNKQGGWTICKDCQGRGQKSRRVRKKMKLRYKRALEEFENSNRQSAPPIRPKGHLYSCLACSGSGLIPSIDNPRPDFDNYPHVAIVGGGIGGVALGVACLHRGIPFTLYERDTSFDTRSQGYGLTLQQASKAIAAFGLVSLEGAIVSTRHLVHTTKGKVVAEWGVRKWLEPDVKTSSKRTNIHISRQSLRLALLKQLKESDSVQWGHKLIDFKKCENGSIDLDFEVEGRLKTTKTDLVVGADGIRSTLRSLLIDDKSSPMRYLGCIVILGICRLEDLGGLDNPLLDSATVFQTANGNERIYVMPYDSNSVMWQLSFPMSQEEARMLSAKGPKALKKEAYERTDWHDPIPQIVSSTPEELVSGYPVYDRALLKPELFEKKGAMTLIGDAAHPMSPFKGQGANQALLDALSLARGISKGCRPFSEWREIGIRKKVLIEFESEMLQRTAVKVKDSADAAEFLHSEVALYEGDEPRGRCLKRQG